MHHKALPWGPYSKNALPLGLDRTDIGRNLLCGISLLVFFLVIQQDWLPSQKGFSIDGDKILQKSEKSRESSRKTCQWETVKIRQILFWGVIKFQLLGLPEKTG
jgi:hypothetical protein